MGHSYSKLALKPYLEKVETYCGQLSKEKLTEIILLLAGEASVAERTLFLDKIQTISSEKISIDDGAADSFLQDIEALKEEIQERVDAIENGSYWDDNDDWDDPYYDHEPDYVTEDQLDELEGYFSEIEEQFLKGDLERAREGYQALFQLLSETDADPDFFDAVELREARARYCRSVYETAPKGRLMDDFVLAMNDNVYSQYEPVHTFPAYPMLQDVMDAKTGEMADFENFLPKWRKVLSDKEPADRRALLLLEVVQLLEGSAGIIQLARTWKDEQPWGYHFWLQQLKEKKEWKEILKTGKEALQHINKSHFRERIADFMIHAGNALNDADSILKGKRDKFYSRPDDRNMLILLEEAIEQNTRDKELQRVFDFFEAEKDKDSDRKSLYVRALLAAGDLSKPYELVKKDKGVGWSYNNTGIVFAAILFVATNNKKMTTVINSLLEMYALRMSFMDLPLPDALVPKISFIDEIQKGLMRNDLSHENRVKYIEWADRVGQARIEQIVSNKHRGAYDRAAQVLGSLVELYASLGEEDKAKKMLHNYYQEKFIRFSAFRKEVKSVIRQSRLLRRLKISV